VLLLFETLIQQHTDHMDLTSVSFWEQFHNRGGCNHEWYFTYARCSAFIASYLSSCGAKPLIALHCGSGDFPAPAVGTWGVGSPALTLNYDFAANCMLKIKPECEILLADALLTPYKSHMFDVIIEKGLFDSVTSGGSVSGARRLLAEYHRLLSLEGGIVFIFSIFGPNAEKKDMMGLLCHEKLQVECQSLYLTPAEIPDQDFCFVYIIRKIIEAS
jgi:hypothetical protein